MKRIILLIIIIIALTSVVLSQTNGTNTIVKSTLANGGGGGISSDGQLSLTGTIGQADAIQSSTNGLLTVSGGFWTSEISPTAANVLISGRIITAEGLGIRNVRVSLTDTSTNEIRQSVSSSFGNFRFIDVEVGKTYILTVNSKRFTFNPNTRILSPNEDLPGENFVAENVQ
jgi:hypothetical protein